LTRTSLRIASAVGRPEIAVGRQIAAPEPVLDRDPGALHAGRPVVGRIEIEAQHVAAAIEIAAVEQQHAFAIVDARLRAGRQHEAAQQRRDALGIDREIETGERLVRRSIALAGLQFEQLVGIDRDRVGLHRGGCRDCAGDNLALHQQALHARLDQAGAELRKVENA